MPFARIDLIQGKTPEYRAAVADIVYRGILNVLKAPDGDRFVVVGEHTADNLIYDPKFLGFSRSADFMLIHCRKPKRHEVRLLPVRRRRVENQAGRPPRRHHDQHGICRQRGLVVWRRPALVIG